MIKTARFHWGEPPWPSASELPASPVRAISSNSPHSEVAIIGAGLTGTSTALHLARRGIRATVYEAGSVAEGASGRTGGLVLEGTAAGVLDEVGTCVAGLERLVADEQIDCDLHLPGCWEIQHRGAAPEKMLPWTDGGRPVCIMKNIAGGVVAPVALTGGLARAAIRAGVIIREHARVTRISLEPELAIEVGGDRITPSHLVIATNAWINATLPDTPPLSSCLTFACATQPLDPATLDAIGLGAGVPFYTTDMPYLWGRTMTDSRVIFGAGLVFGAPSDLEHADVREGESHSVLERMQLRVRGLHPKLAEVQFSAAWGGPIAFTEDTVPLLGAHPRNPRVMVSGAYAGHGVALSVRAGELLALAIADHRPLPKWGSLAR
jgi:gamma-glutamylputrescine oxidase